MKLLLTGILFFPLLVATPTTRKVQERSQGILVGIEEAPSNLPINGEAKFRGGVFAGEVLADQAVVVKWTEPDGSIHSERIRYGNDGLFQFNIKMHRPGVYRFNFTGVDNRNTVTREVIVTDAVAIRRTLERKAKRAQELADRIAARSRQRVHSAPSGPRRDEAEQRLAELERQRAAANEGLNHILAAADACESLTLAPPDVQADAMEALGDLASWADSTDDEANEMEQFEQRTRSDSGVCDSLETAAEGLRFVATATALLTRPMAVLQDTIKGQLVPKAKAKVPPVSEEVKFAVDRAKAEADAARSGLDGIIRSLPTQARETSLFIIENLVKSYCSVLEGPVTAELNVNVPEKGAMFYKYKLILKAKLRLIADKSKPAGADGVEYHGRIEGGASKVEFAENIFAVEPMPKGSKILLRKVVTPPVMKEAGGDLIGSGQIARIASPGHFNVQYIGLLNEQGMKLKQDRVVDDFTALFKNRVGLVVLPQGGLIPKVTIFDFPMQKAAWVLDRCTKGAFELPKILDGNKLHLQKEFTRSETTANGIKVDWKVSYDAVGDK